MALHEKLRRAREARNWTVHEAAQRMAGVGKQQLYNLETKPEDGKPDPSKVTVHTAAAIVVALWPDIQLADFLPDFPALPLRFTPRDRNSRRRLKGYEAIG